MDRRRTLAWGIGWGLVLLWATATWGVQDLTSRITAVSIYADQALVTRQAETTVNPGVHHLRIGTTAFQVDPDSVAARISGEGTILGVQFKSIPLEQAAQPQIKALEDRIADLRHTLRKLKDQKQGLGKQEQFLEGFLAFAPDQVGKELATRMPTPEELQKTLVFLADNYQGIYTSRQTLDQSMEAAQRELTRLERELAAMQDRAGRTRRVVEVIFETVQDQAVSVETDYLVRNVTWEPLYKVSVPSSLARAELSMFARIVQKSGEDWEDVAVEISNAVPTRGVALPELATWWLDVPRPMVRAKTVGAMQEMAIDADMAPMAAKPAAAPLAQAQRRRSALAFAYLPPQPVSIPSRAQETLVPLYTKELSGDFYHYAIPKQDPRAFLVCEAKADSELLPGRLNVYFDGRYLGRTHLAEQTAGQSFRLNLGIDREVKVQRRKVTDKIKETYFGKIDRDSVVRQLTYHIEAANHKNQPVTLKLRDHLPVARTDRIKVKDITLTPEPATRNDEDREGVARWELSLTPGQTQTVTMDFVVIHPKEMVIPTF